MSGWVDKTTQHEDMLGHQSQAHSTHQAPLEARFKEALRLNRGLFFSSPITLYQEHTNSVPSYSSLEAAVVEAVLYKFSPILSTMSRSSNNCKIINQVNMSNDHVSSTLYTKCVFCMPGNVHGV